MREFGKIITRKTDLTDAQVQEKYKFPAIIILHDNEDQILKITHYQKNGTKNIYDFSQSASKQFVTDSIATAIAGMQDNRLEFNELSDFPAIGDETKFYIDLSEDQIYIWDSNSQTYKNQSSDTANVGSRSQQLSLSSIFRINQDGNANKVDITAGILFSQNLDKTWTVPALVYTVPDNDYRYVYAKASKTTSAASIYLSKNQILFDSDANDYYFLVGILHSVVDGFRVLSITIGTATISGGLIRTGIISSLDGLTSFNLNTGEIKGKITFSSGSSGYENLTDKPDLSSFEQTRDYVNSTLQTDLTDLKNRADGVIESWFYSHTPTLSNLPASNWVTTEERNAHIGDTFTNMQEFVDNVTTPDAGKAWRFVKNETTGEFSWSLIANSDSTKALIEAGKAKDTADAKRRVFVSQPYPPYNVGDLWVQGNNGDIMRCKFERLSGTYVATDFEKASKYTDDTAVNNLQIGGRNLFAFKNLGNYLGGDINTNKSFFTVSGSRISVNSNPHDLLGNKVTVVPGSDILIHGKTDLPIQTVYYRFENGSQLTLYVPTVNGRFQFSLTVPNNATYLNIGLGEYPYLSPYYLEDVKIEKGNKASDWTPAPEDVEVSIEKSKQDSINASKAYADAQNEVKRIEIEAYADGIVTAAEQRAITDATNKAEAAKTYAAAQDALLKTQLESYADGVVDAEEQARINQAQSNLNAAKAYADAQDNLAKIAANAYADGVVSEEEARAIADATAKMEEAKSHAQTLVNNVQIGGRNLVLNSNVNITGIGLLKVFNLSEPLVIGEVYTASMKGTASDGNFILWGNLNADYILNLPSGTSGVVSTVFTVPNWANLTQVSVYNEYTTNPGTLNWIKIEKGNKATDWTPAPEDIQLQIDVESAKVINLEHKTDFLTGTTIEGNAIATGTLLVGNSDGTNAGITGLGSSSDGVYLWGGGTYQQMVQGLAKKEQRRNGIDIWRHPNGQIGFEIGIKDGRLIFNGYHSSGFKLFELDPNRGLVNVSYTQESWTETPFRKLNYSSSTFDESTITNEIKLAIIKQSKMEYYTPPPYTTDSEFGYTTTYNLSQNAVGYDYDNGTNPANSSYESLKGMKANYGDRNTNMSNGWYVSSIGEIHMETEWNSYPPMTYTFTVYVYYYQNGKITQTKVVTVTK